MPNKKNIDEVKNLREKISKTKSIILTEYQGLKSNDINALRARMLEEGAEVDVIKNTLFKIALEQEKINTTDLAKNLKGTTAAILSYKDAISPIKVLIEFTKKLHLPNIKAAIIDGKYTTAESVDILSKLPSKEQLIAQVLGGFKSPISGFVNTLRGTRNKLVYVLADLAKKKEVL